ncbi:MAG: hypothetical protein ABIT05_08165, partial [Chitinophagaceae bacterium]
YYKSTKSMKVTETARIKGLTPADWSDCLQTHILSYQKEGDTEELTGRWVTAPGQVGDCGLGKTTLVRRTVSRDLSSFNKSKSGTPFSSQRPAPKATRPPVNPPTAGSRPKKAPVAPPVVKKNTTRPKPKVTAQGEPLSKTAPVERDVPQIITPEVKKLEVPIVPRDNNSFEKRSNSVLKTIEIENASFKVDLYDNGDIDGDSISLFYNGRLLLSHKKLSDKPITLTLEATSGKAMNELTMYADNLGEIPPNTALMVVTDGDKRYEVRITSDLKKSGSIRFVHKGG